MVLGFILYEAFDIAYHLGAITVNGTKYVYKWYYGIEDEQIIKEKEIEMLRLRIKDLEKKLLTDRSSEDHKKAE